MVKERPFYPPKSDELIERLFQRLLEFRYRYLVKMLDKDFFAVEDVFADTLLLFLEMDREGRVPPGKEMDCLHNRSRKALESRLSDPWTEVILSGLNPKHTARVESIPDVQGLDYSDIIAAVIDSSIADPGFFPKEIRGAVGFAYGQGLSLTETGKRLRTERRVVIRRLEKANRSLRDIFTALEIFPREIDV